MGRKDGTGCKKDCPFCACVVLDAKRPTLRGKSGDALLDVLVFAGNDNPVRDVMVGGRWLVEDGHHVAEHAALAELTA